MATSTSEVITWPLAFHGWPVAPSRERTEMMQTHGLGGDQGRGMLWLAQRNDSLHIGFGEGEKSWRGLAREQIQQLSHFRQPARD